MNFGFLVFGVTEYSAKMLTLHYGVVVDKEPRGDADEAVCRLLGQRLAEWVATYIHAHRDQHPQMKLAERMRPG